MKTSLQDADASFIGENGGDRSSTSIAGVGDVNGDTIDDFLIGAFANADVDGHAGLRRGHTHTGSDPDPGTRCCPGNRYRSASRGN